MKGLPLTYNRDLQEDKAAFFDSVDTFKVVLKCMTGMIGTLEFNQSAIDQALQTGFILATEVADYLVLKGMPFRDAHEVTGQLVQVAEEKGCDLMDLDLATFQSQSELFESDIHDVLGLDSAINRKNLVGGTSTQQVQFQLKRLKEAYL